jgi:hypothetical protein
MDKLDELVFGSPRLLRLKEKSIPPHQVTLARRKDPQVFDARGGFWTWRRHKDVLSMGESSHPGTSGQKQT